MGKALCLPQPLLALGAQEAKLGMHLPVGVQLEVCFSLWS